MKAFITFTSVCIRLICILIACMTLLSFTAMAFMAASVPQGEPFIPGWQIISSVLGVGAVLASGYIMFAVGWQTRFMRPGYRGINFVLLLLAFSVQVFSIASSRLSILPTNAAVIVTLFTALLMLLCFKPGLRAIEARPD